MPRILARESPTWRWLPGDVALAALRHPDGHFGLDRYTERPAAGFRATRGSLSLPLGRNRLAPREAEDASFAANERSQHSLGASETSVAPLDAAVY